MSKKTNKKYAVALGAVIARERKSRDWSATAFAEALGVSRSCVSAWEVAISSPTWANLIDIAAALRLTPSTLVRRAELEFESMKK